MRLTCPNCGTEYDVPGGMVPGAGRHVQCSACHTRWFVRGTAAVASEEQILTRLENWRPRPVAVASDPAARPDAASLVATRPRPAETLYVVPPAASDQPEPIETPVLTEAPAEAARPVEPAPIRLAPPSPARERPGKPAERPTVGRPAPVADGPLRPSPRLDLDRERVQPEPMAPPRSRFLHGLLLVLIPALLAFGAYRLGDRIAATVPAAAPALDAYAGTLDGWREGLERLIAPYRSGGAG